MTSKLSFIPKVGPVQLQCQILFTQDQGQALLVFTALPGSEDHSKLQMLSGIGPQRLTHEQTQ